MYLTWTDDVFPKNERYVLGRYIICFLYIAVFTVYRNGTSHGSFI